MESGIKLKLRGNTNAVDMFIQVGGAVTIFIWLACLSVYFSVGSLIGFLLVLAGYGIYLYFYLKYPAIVTADSEKLMYKQLFFSATVLLKDIVRISCEPYFVRSRYHAEQRIRLVVYTEDDELELSDHVNSNELISDKLEEKETDIPLIRLYRFLMKETGRA